MVKAGSGALLAGRLHGNYNPSSNAAGGSSIGIRSPYNLSDEDTNENFEKESYPAFYMSDENSRFLHTSVLSYKYDSFSNAASAIYTQANPGLELCILLNRVWHLERLILGNEEIGPRDESGN